MNRSPLFSAVAITLIVYFPAFAESPPARIDLTDFKVAKSVDNVIVPLPSEVFNVLDKIGSPNWKDELRDISIQTGKRYQIALLLGTVIADGFVAVEATDTERVKTIGRDVLKLSAAIGVEDAVKARSNSIIEKADAGDWRGVRRELDGAQHDVRDAMTQLDDDQLANLVSIGGWLRGTEVLTSILKKTYSEDGADLLHQPDLLLHFQNQLKAMPSSIRKSSLVGQIENRLREVAPLIQTNDISKRSVGEINDITKALVKSIQKKDA